MSKLTITEALAEIPTITKRVSRKEEFVYAYLHRQSAVRDPHDKDGGSVLLIEREMQGIADLQARLIAIRSAIQRANATNTITVGNQTRSIMDWLTWRREVSPMLQRFYGGITNKLNQVRQQALQKGVGVSEKDAGFSMDFVININEREHADKIENLETTLGTLDGQLSLKNATIMIDVP